MFLSAAASHFCRASLLSFSETDKKVKFSDGQKTYFYDKQRSGMVGVKKKKKKRKEEGICMKLIKQEVLRSQFCLTDSFLLLYFTTCLNRQNKQNNNEDDCWDSGKEWEDERLTERWRWRGEEQHCNSCALISSPTAESTRKRYRLMPAGFLNLLCSLCVGTSIHPLCLWLPALKKRMLGSHLDSCFSLKFSFAKKIKMQHCKIMLSIYALHFPFKGITPWNPPRSLCKWSLSCYLVTRRESTTPLWEVWARNFRKRGF